MSSFANPHRLYLFELEDGRRKLAYGRDPTDALEILAMRLTREEMVRIRKDRWIRIRQQDLHRYIGMLG
jgi:hypothetical protein